MSNSYAEIATGWQGSGNYPGHDVYQNGIINDSCDRVYMAGWQNDWASATWTDDRGIDHLSASGYFTDQATIDSCMSGDKLNTNELDSALQTKLSDFSSSSYDADGNKIQGDFQAHSNVSAYDIDHDRLAELKTENLDLYNRLTNPDGLSPDGSGIKAAYGQAEANPQHGSGGGNQYYMDPQTFKDGLDAGVFKYNPDASFSVDGSTGRGIERSDISPQDYGAYDGGKYNNDLVAAMSTDKEKMDAMAAERANSGQGEAEQINTQKATENPNKPYITDPDPAYEMNSGMDFGGENANNEKGLNAEGDNNQNNPGEGKGTDDWENTSEGEETDGQKGAGEDEGTDSQEMSGEDECSEGQENTEEGEKTDNQENIGEDEGSESQENSGEGEGTDNQENNGEDEGTDSQENIGEGEKSDDQESGEQEARPSERMPNDTGENQDNGEPEAGSSEGMPNDAGESQDNGGPEAGSSEEMPNDAGESQDNGGQDAGASEGMPNDSGVQASSEPQEASVPVQTDGMGM